MLRQNSQKYNIFKPTEIHSSLPSAWSDFLLMTLSRYVWASLPPCILLQVCLGISSPLHPVCPFPFINHETNAFSMASRSTPLATRQFLSAWLCNWVNYVHLISVVLVHIVHVRDTSNYDESSSLGTLVPLQSSNLFHIALLINGPPTVECSHPSTYSFQSSFGRSASGTIL